jgi:endoglucanase
MAGPVVDRQRQPVGGGWWLIGPSNDPPHGLQTEWGVGHWRPEQLGVTDRMLMR